MVRKTPVGSVRALVFQASLTFVRCETIGESPLLLSLRNEDLASVRFYASETILYQILCVYVYVCIKISN